MDATIGMDRADDPKPRIHAIVLAAGGGSRFDSDKPKQFIRLAGQEILTRSIRAILGAGVDQLIVVANPLWMDETRALVAAIPTTVPTKVVAGGETRNQSTRAGLAALGGADDDVVLVHDAVRPLVRLDAIQRSISPILNGDADATDTVIQSADTLVQVDDNLVVEIPDRARFRRGQTPQVFRNIILQQAYAAAAAAGELTATDDCGLVLRFVPAARVVAVAGDETNVKITTRLDFLLADRLLQMRALEARSIPDLTVAHGLEGARILIIGGTRGLGLAIAEEAGRLGARVEVGGRSVGLDVRSYPMLASSVDAAATRLSGIDHVIVTAGTLRVGPLIELRPEELAEVVNVNLTGSLNVARAVYGHLAATGGSLTLFTSSSFTYGRANYVAYSSSKAGVVNLAQGLADEWHDVGIRVNAVSPERANTEMRRRAFPNESTTELVSPLEVAAATLRLVQSDLTGQVLDIRREVAHR
jgi:ribitol-5-phosphate 2-dehydrogenase (NADP+) / D-ribitol-5-phosphate cytidylyltransferase